MPSPRSSFTFLSERASALNSTYFKSTSFETELCDPTEPLAK